MIWRLLQRIRCYFRGGHKESSVSSINGDRRVQRFVCVICGNERQARW